VITHLRVEMMAVRVKKRVSNDPAQPKEQ